jgi:Tfp pilus assembly protein PilF
MRAFFLAAAATAIAASPASGSVLTVGGSYAESCYHYAEDHATSLIALMTCDRALTEQALSSEDQFATFVNRGIVKMRRGEVDGAQADFSRAIAMQPKRGEPWLNMAVLQFDQGNSRAAIPLFDKAVALGTDAPELAHYGRGLAYEDVGDLKSAYADLRRAVELRPRWAEPARELARYQVRRP